MSQTQADSDMMATAAGRFELVNSSLTKMLTDLMNELAVLQSGWKGIAATEFDRVKAQYHQDLSELNQALLDTAESIRASGTGYRASDSAAASRVSQSTGGGLTLPL